MKMIVSGLITLSALAVFAVPSQASNHRSQASSGERVCTLVRWPAVVGAAPVFECKVQQAPRHRSRARRAISPSVR